MTESKSAGRKLLFVKAVPGDSDLLWLDRLCHGLLSWSLARGLLKNDQVSQMVLLAPDYGEIDRVYLWPQKKPFPWKQIPIEERESGQVFWAGHFSAAELEEAQRLFPSLKEWAQPEIRALSAEVTA